jgi:hypothetical protein
MIPHTSADNPSPGLFERLAAQQLAPPERNAAPRLRPRLDFVFDESLLGKMPATPAAGLCQPWLPEPPEPVPPSPFAARETAGTRPVSHPEPPTRATADEPRIRAAQVPGRPRSADPIHPIQQPNFTTRPETRSAPPAAEPAPRTNILHTRERILQMQPAVPSRESAPPATRTTPQRESTTPPPAALQRATRKAPLAALRAQLERPPAAEPTIEINIGRLEVRAPAAPPAEPAHLPSSPPDRRLGAYLRSRENGARS